MSGLATVQETQVQKQPKSGQKKNMAPWQNNYLVENIEAPFFRTWSSGIVHNSYGGDVSIAYVRPLESEQQPTTTNSPLVPPLAASPSIPPHFQSAAGSSSSSPVTSSPLVAGIPTSISAPVVKQLRTSTPATPEVKPRAQEKGEVQFAVGVTGKVESKSSVDDEESSAESVDSQSAIDVKTRSLSMSEIEKGRIARKKKSAGRSMSHDDLPVKTVKKKKKRSKKKKKTKDSWVHGVVGGGSISGGSGVSKLKEKGKGQAKDKDGKKDKKVKKEKVPKGSKMAAVQTTVREKIRRASDTPTIQRERGMSLEKVAVQYTKHSGVTHVAVTHAPSFSPVVVTRLNPPPPKLEKSNLFTGK